MGLGVVALLTSACGPGIGEMRMAYAPPREPSCTLDFLQLDMQDLAPGGKYREIVRPRACAMRGEGVGILATGTAAPMALSMGGTAVDYVVVRKQPPPSAAGAPQKF
jgi:hypothetical protein